MIKKNKMPQALKQKWIDALRSGNYKQGRSWLFYPKDNSFCCLGVLEDSIDGEVEMIHSQCSKSLPTKQWADNHGIYFDGMQTNETDNIAHVWPNLFYDNQWLPAYTINDRYVLSFNEIADLIEDQIEGY
jgi:hypothetical protein